MANMTPPIINPATLTEEQREAIKEEYKIQEDWYSQCQRSEWDERFDQCRAEGAMSTLETLFGKDFFKEE